MAWRTVPSKTGPRRYFYATERVNGEVRTFYLGYGPVAERAAKKQEHRHELRRARQRAIADVVALKKLGADTFHEIDLLLRAALVACGYYRHARGQWRTRRCTRPKDHNPFPGSPPPVPTTHTAVPTDPSLPASQPPVRTTLKELIEQANSGNQIALDGLRKYLREHPHAWERVGDVASHALEARIRQIARDNQLLAESIRMQVKDLRLRLTGPTASTIEMLAAEEVGVAWLELNHVRLAAQYQQNRPLGCHFAPLENVATRRYSVALKTFLFVQAKRPEIERASKVLAPQPETPADVVPGAPQPTP
jgi:hypothetical protein